MALLLDNARRQVRAVAQWLNLALETSGETQARILYQPLETALIRVAVDLRIFNALSGGQKGSKSLDELASVTKADPALLARILRSLAAFGAVRQTYTNEFRATWISETFTQPSLRDGSKFCFDVVGMTWQYLPEFLRKTGHKEPFDGRNCAFNMAFCTDEPFFDFLTKNPKFLEVFNSYMTSQRQGRQSWLEFFPLEQELVTGFSGEGNAVMFVDIGGGYGHEIQEVKKRYPDLPGRMILQDLPDTINQITAAPNTEAMAYNFFTPQLIRGARAYYLRNILHDWPDTQCREILQRTASAMKRDYSKLLINEWCLRDRGSSIYATLLDINMMAVCAGMERTEIQWEELLKSSGLKISKIWSASQDAESLIEAVLE